jgi:hypothetical protein
MLMLRMHYLGGNEEPTGKQIPVSCALAGRKVRFTPESGHRETQPPSPKSPNSGLVGRLIENL